VHGYGICVWWGPWILHWIFFVIQAHTKNDVGSKRRARKCTWISSKQGKNKNIDQSKIAFDSWICAHEFNGNSSINSISTMSSCYWTNYIIIYSNHGNKLFNLGSLKQHLKWGNNELITTSLSILSSLTSWLKMKIYI